MPRELFFCGAIFPADKIADFIMLCEGRAVKGTQDIRRVRHGGENANTGELQEALSPRDLILAALERLAQVTRTEIVTEGAKHKHTPGAIDRMLAKMQDEKLIKRVAPATYALASKVKASRAPARAKAKAKAKAKKKSEQALRTGEKAVGAVVIAEGGIKDRLLTLIQKKQNGNGHGVPLDIIKKGLPDVKHIGPYLTDLVQAQVLTRTAPGEYRAAAQ